MRKRIAVLGVTGSIGRQALDVIEANEDLELVAASSGSTPIDGLAPLTQVGGDARELLERAQPDVVLNAIVAAAAALGDLFESAFKRDLHVKDSGRILAGHGGVLDRVDAFLFALPAAYFTVLTLT